MMVTQWGMSERLGPRTFGRKEELIFLGREISEQRDYSEKVAEEIDDEVRRLVEQARETAHRLVSENRHILDRVARKLIEDETVEGDDIGRLFSDNGDFAADAPVTTPRQPSQEDEPQAPRTDAPKPRPAGGLVWGGGTASSTLLPPEQPLS